MFRAIRFSPWCLRLTTGIYLEQMRQGPDAGSSSLFFTWSKANRVHTQMRRWCFHQWQNQPNQPRQIRPQRARLQRRSTIRSQQGFVGFRKLFRADLTVPSYSGYLSVAIVVDCSYRWETNDLVVGLPFLHCYVKVYFLSAILVSLDW